VRFDVQVDGRALTVRMTHNGHGGWSMRFDAGGRVGEQVYHDASAQTRCADGGWSRGGNL